MFQEVEGGQYVPVSTLVFDKDLHPRHGVDTQTVNRYAEAMRCGSRFPPIVIDKKSRKVISGFHRCDAAKKVHGPDVPVYVIEIKYSSPKKMLLAALEYNNQHGKPYTSLDLARCTLLADKYGIPRQTLATLLNLRTKRLTNMIRDRFATLQANGDVEELQGVVDGKVVLKKSVKHLHDTDLTPYQVKENKKVGGHRVSYLVRQILLFLNTPDFLDPEDEASVTALLDLRDRLCRWFDENGVS